MLHPLRGNLCKPHATVKRQTKNEIKSASEKDAEKAKPRCVSCGQVIHDGDYQLCQPCTIAQIVNYLYE